MITTTNGVPQNRRAIILFDPQLKARWSDVPKFAGIGRPPWEFCFKVDAEIVKTCFARCLVAIDEPTFEARFNLEVPLTTYRVRLSRTGIDQAPVLALFCWLDNRWDALTKREREVVALTAKGIPSTEIGRRLGVTRSSIDTHRSRARSKLGIRTLPALAIWAQQQILDLPSAEDKPLLESVPTVVP